jgi:hypothetical protein
MVTVKAEVFPTMAREPLFRASVMSVTLTVEFAVTVRVPEEMDQPDPELAAEEIVSVCALTPPADIRPAAVKRAQ